MRGAQADGGAGGIRSEGNEGSKIQVPSKEVARMLLQLKDGLMGQEEIAELLRSLAIQKTDARGGGTSTACGESSSAMSKSKLPSAASRLQTDFNPNPSEGAAPLKPNKTSDRDATDDEEGKRRSNVERHDDAAKLEIQRAEPGASPLESATSWSDLNLSQALLRGVESLGFRKPSKIQAAALPLVLNHRENLIAQAQNGSGKTATFALSMLSCVQEELLVPQALCVCPTRELAQQTVVVLKDISRFTHVDIFLAVPQTRPGASSLDPPGSDELEERFCKNADGRLVVFTTNTIGDVCQQVVVGTPGKTVELLKKRVLKAKGIRMFVLDEADELINYSNNMAPQVQQIRRFLNSDIQILLFSATYSDSVRAFAEKLIPRANKITLKREELTLTCIRQFYMVADPSQPLPEGATSAEGDELLQTLDPSVLSVLGKGHFRGGRCTRPSRDELLRVFLHKYAYLKTLYSALAVGQSVIFVNSRRLAFFLALKLQDELNFSVSLICGSQSQGPEKLSIEIRDKIMREFRKGETKVLICTDVLARGIDVPQVTLVVNFDLPIYYNRGFVGPETGGGGNSPPAEADHCWSLGSEAVPNAPNSTLRNIAGDGPCVNFETYLHRIGRTGRFGLKGISVNLVSPQEMFLIDQIKAFYGCNIDELDSDPEAIEAIIKSLRTQQ